MSTTRERLYYCSARYYDPATRQWTTADSAKADGEESAYQYCGGNPVVGTDDSGLRLDWGSEGGGYKAKYVPTPVYYSPHRYYSPIHYPPSTWELNRARSRTPNRRSRRTSQA